MELTDIARLLLGPTLEIIDMGTVINPHGNIHTFTVRTDSGRTLEISVRDVTDINGPAEMVFK